jgi:hypothetical protein
LVIFKLNEMKKSLVFLLLVITATLSIAQNATIRGFVYEKDNGEPMMFANVFLEGTTIGATTDGNGFYTMTKVPAGTYVLVATTMNFEAAKISITVKKDGIQTQKLFLKEAAETLNEVVITGKKQEAQTQVTMSVVKLTPKQIKSLPSVGGEADIAQYLQVLPGVVFTGDQGGQLYIRGGSPIQNKVLLDGMIIYNPFHSIGLFSVFDTDIIRKADIYTGGFNAEYGGRISSIMDITTRDGNKKKISGKVGASPFGAKAMIEGPLKKQTEDGGGSSSFVFSGKTSYLEQSSKLLYTYMDNSEDTSALFNTWDAPPTGTLPFNYTDLYGKLSFNSANGSKVNFFGFNFRDRVNYQNISDLQWNTYGGGSNFVIIPGTSPVLVEGVFAWSTYEISLQEPDSRPKSSSIGGFNGGLDFTYFMGDNEFKYGFELISFSTDFTFYNQVGAKIEQNENTNEFGGYLKYKVKHGNLVIEPSFRLHYYSSLSTTSPEPRLGFKYNLTDNIRIKGAGGMYSQNLISANSDRDVVNLFYGFLSGEDNLQKEVQLQNGKTRDVTHALQKANHAILGVEADLSKKVTLNVEGYYKQFTQLTNLNRNKVYEDVAENGGIEDVLKKDFIVETGDAYGVDVVINYDYKRLYVWFVYSLGKVSRFDGVHTDLDGNLIPYSPVFDKRHNLNFVTTYTFGKDLNNEFSIRWNMGSGFPFTPTQGFYGNHAFGNGVQTDYTEENPELGIYYGELNSARLPYYHRLDLSVKRTIYFSESVILEANAGITNAYNRENVFYFDRVKFKRVNQLPMMPSVGVNLRF